MKTSSSTNNSLNLPARHFYTALDCKCELIAFYLLISHLGLTHVSFRSNSHRQVIEDFKQIYPDIKEREMSDPTTFCKNFFQEVVCGRAPTPNFEENPFIRDATTFQKKIWQRIFRIKAGETMTYGELATAVGSPGGARAAGLACNKNPLPLVIPCHRVVAAGGIGGFAVDLSIKKRLLELEKNCGKS